MGKGNPADWISHPEDLAALVDWLVLQKDRAGDGGNFDKTVFNEAAAYMAENHPPKKGGPKTADAIASKYKTLHRLYVDLTKVKQKAFVGASGWTYTHDSGFSVTEDSQAATENTHREEFKTTSTTP